MSGTLYLVDVWVESKRLTPFCRWFKVAAEAQAYQRELDALGVFNVQPLVARCSEISPADLG